MVITWATLVFWMAMQWTELNISFLKVYSLIVLATVIVIMMVITKILISMNIFNPKGVIKISWVWRLFIYKCRK